MAAAWLLLLAACDGNGGGEEADGPPTTPSTLATTLPPGAGPGPSPGGDPDADTGPPDTSTGADSGGTATTATTATTAGGGTPAAGGVALLAVELFPEDPSPGGQHVVVVNRGDRPVDVGCWRVRSAARDASAVILADEPLAPGAGLRLIPEQVVFATSDTVSLVDDGGQLADRSPPIEDTAGDDRLWYRDEGGTWVFGRGLRLPQDLDDARLVASSSRC